MSGQEQNMSSNLLNMVTQIKYIFNMADNFLIPNAPRKVKKALRSALVLTLDHAT